MDNNIEKVFGNYEIYENLSDEELVEKIQCGNSEAEEYIYSRYSQIMKRIVAKFYIVGADKDDLLQEAMLGLYNAVSEFNPNKQCMFKSYACICIKRQIISFIRTSKRQKNNPLYNYLSFNKIMYEDNDVYLIEKITNNSCEDPENIIMIKEYEKNISTMIDKHLSDFEKQVLMYYKEGLSYVEISNKLNKDMKSVDNALQRIKKKLRKDIYNR